MEFLRDEVGADGYVVGDSQTVEFVYIKHKHNVAEDYDDAVRQVLEAGLNVCTHFTPPQISSCLAGECASPTFPKSKRLQRPWNSTAHPVESQVPLKEV